MSWVADGIVAEKEYAHQAEGGGGTFYWSNDAEHLYMLVTSSNADYSDPDEMYYDFIRICFDDNNDGLVVTPSRTPISAA